QRAVSGTQIGVLDTNADRRFALREQRQIDRIVETLFQNGRYFPRHTVMSPQIGTMRQRFVVDLYDVVGSQSQRLACFEREFEDSFALAVQADLRAAGE